MDTPPLLIPVAAMGKCKQANEFQSCHYGHPTSLIIHEQNRPIRDSRLSYLKETLLSNRRYAPNLKQPFLVECMKSENESVEKASMHYCGLSLK